MDASHYFSPDADADAARFPVTVDLPGRTVQLESAPGVFSARGLDRATAVLLRTEPPLAPAGDLLDLGCGWGPMALTMALRAPEATVWAVDVNPLARELTAANARRLGLGSVRVAAPEDVPAGVRFATIWSNPPIRVGKAPLHELLAAWLGRLADDGTASLVVGKNLGADSLQRWIRDQLSFGCERVASAKGFRVLEVARTDRGEQPGLSG